MTYLVVILTHVLTPWLRKSCHTGENQVESFENQKQYHILGGVAEIRVVGVTIPQYISLHLIYHFCFCKNLSRWILGDDKYQKLK